MKVAVLVKRVPDTASVLKIAPDGQSVDRSGLKFVMSPYDEHAVEAAIQLKEAQGGEVVIVSAGAAEAKETIRSALAMGADSGLLVTGEGTDALSSKGVAQLLAAAVKRIAPDLVLAGKQAVDDDAAQVPERMAELLDWPHASVLTRLEVKDGAALVNREIEGGHYTLEMPLPAVFTVDKALNNPRYPTLPNIMKAKRKPIEEVKTADLCTPAEAIQPAMTLVGLSLPRQDRLCKILEGEREQQVAALLTALREEEKVL